MKLCVIRGEMKGKKVYLDQNDAERVWSALPTAKGTKDELPRRGDEDDVEVLLDVVVVAPSILEVQDDVALERRRQQQPQQNSASQEDTPQMEVSHEDQRGADEKDGLPEEVLSAGEGEILWPADGEFLDEDLVTKALLTWLLQ